MVKPGALRPESSRLSPRVIKSHPEADTKGIVLSCSQPLAPQPRTIGEENLGHLSSRVRQ